MDPDENIATKSIKTFKDSFSQLESAISHHSQFCMSLLLKDIDEPERQQFPYVHYVVFETGKNDNCIEYDANWHKVLRTFFAAKGQRSNQGVYKTFQAVTKSNGFSPSEEDDKFNSQFLNVTNIMEIMNLNAFRCVT
ncbi:hypothetical protein Ciccas_013388, partial [Cichlidogyrus casuarinus]